MGQEQSPTDANATDKQTSSTNKQLIEKNRIFYYTEGEEPQETPFTAVKINEHWYLFLGKHRITEGFETEEQVIENSKRADWWRIMTICRTICEQYDEEKEFKLKQQLDETINKQQLSLNLNKQ